MKTPHDERTLAKYPCCCMFCDRRFANVFSLRQHEKASHGLNPPKRERRPRDEHFTEADWQTWMQL